MKILSHKGDSKATEVGILDFNLRPINNCTSEYPIPSNGVFRYSNKAM